MDERIMIRPTAAQPRLKQLVFPVTKLGIEFLFEEPLHTLRVLGRAALSQSSPNLRCDHRGCGFNSSRPSLSHWI